MAYSVKSAPLAKLGAKSMVNLMFPLEDQPTYHTHHILFTIYESTRESRNAPDKTTPIATIKLPMTQELQVSYNAGYANPDLGGLTVTALAAATGSAGAIAELATRNTNENVAAIKSIAEKVMANPASLLTGAANLGVNATGAGLNFIAGIGGQTIQAGLNAFGIARNPHKATLFEGTDFRSHSFSFRFSPMRASESDAIRNIIHLFKYHMHPGYAAADSAFGAGNHFFSTPEFFKIKLSNEGKYTVNDYQICVLKGMTVNYQPSNYPAYVRVSKSEPAPMEVIMNLEFQETAIITKEVIGDPYMAIDQMKANARGASD